MKITKFNLERLNWLGFSIFLFGSGIGIGLNNTNDKTIHIFADTLLYVGFSLTVISYLLFIILRSRQKKNLIRPRG